MARRTDTVVIGWVHPAEVSAHFANALLQTVVGDLTAAGRQVIAGTIDEFSSANISGARNKIVRRFLEEHDADWLLFVDSDMVWRPDAIRRLLADADPETVPIIGGLCHGSNSDELFSTIFIFRDQPDGTRQMTRLLDYPDSTLVQCHGTGAAFLMIHRTVLEKVAAQEFNPAFPWFQETHIGSEPVSEDLTFCMRAGELGFPIYVHTGVEILHHKSTLLSRQKLRNQRTLAALKTPGAAPATGSAMTKE